MERLKIYLLSARPGFFPAIVLPVLLGTSYAWKKEALFNPFFFTLTLSAALLYHAGMNVINDFFDYQNGTDNINKTPLSPFTGGSRMIQKGLMTPEKTLMFAIFLIFSGSAIGLYLSFLTGPLLLFFGAFGLFTGFFYSSPPLFLSGRSLGELFVGINFGLLPVAGSYFVQTGRVDFEVFFVSLPLSFLIAGLLYINEFPDLEADRSSNKKNLAVRLGAERGRFVFPLIEALAYLSLITGVVLGYMPGFSLLALFPAYSAVRASGGIIRNYGKADTLLPSIKSAVFAHFATGLILVLSLMI